MSLSIKDIPTVEPASADIYTQIENRIMSGIAESAETRLRRLLKGEVSLEGKPSVLLNRLRIYNHGGCTVEDWLIQETRSLKSQPTKSQPNWSRSQSRSNSQSRNNGDQYHGKNEKKVRFYHKRFGNKAEFCKSPCFLVQKPNSENYVSFPA